MSKLLMTAEATQLLTVRLGQIKAVAQFDVPGEPQSATLAHALTDLEKSFRQVIGDLASKAFG